MERLTKQLLPTIIAIAAALLTLTGYLTPYQELTALMVRWAAIVAAFALLLGFLNVLQVHSLRLTGGKQALMSRLNSLVLLLTAAVSFIITSAGLLVNLELTRLLSDWWFGFVLLPLQAGAAALVAFALALAAFRLVRGRPNLWALPFLASALVVLIGAIPLPEPLGTPLANLRTWWMETLSLPGMRGLLIGVGLGTLVMGVRLLIGMDRPYSDR